MKQEIKINYYKVIVFIILTPLFFLVTFKLRNLFLDDAYITLTYSKNLFFFNKPYYNVNDKYQGNGQTSIIWMLIQTSFFYFKSISPIILNKAIGVFLYLIIIIKALIHLKTKNIQLNFYTFFLFILYTYWASLNISHGLETFFYSFILLFFLIYSKSSKSLIFIFILPFIKPDAIIISFFNIAQIRKFDKLSIKKIVAFSLSIIGYLLYQNYYYDVIIPLPFILKTVYEFSQAKILNFFFYVGLFLPVLIYSLINFKTKLFFYLPLFFYLFYYSFFVDEVMNIFDRYTFPLLAYLIYFLLYEDISSYFKKFKILFIISLISIFYFIKNFNKEQDYIENNYYSLMVNGPIKIGKLLNKLKFEDNKPLNIATSDAGAIAYFSNSNCYDTWGLNNATLLLTKKDMDWGNYLNYLKKSELDYIILISTDYDKYKPKLDFENKIYKYYKLDNKKLIYKSNTTKNYVYFIYKIKSND